MVVPPTYYTHKQNHYICAYAPAREFHSFHAKYYLCKILIINIYEKWSKKSTNCTITFECEDLGIKITAGKFSQKLQKHIDLFEQPPGRCVITGSHKELIELLVPLGQRSTHPSGEKQHQSSGRFYLPVLWYKIRKRSGREYELREHQIRDLLLSWAGIA